MNRTSEVAREDSDAVLASQVEMIVSTTLLCWALSKPHNELGDIESVEIQVDEKRR